MGTNKDNFVKIGAGTLLIAEPYMYDPHFRRAVVLVCDHNTEGSVGFILNKTVGMNIGSLIADFPEFESEVHFGGPVQTDSIHYIHSKGDLVEGSIEVGRGVYWGGDFEQLKFCIENKLILQDEIRFFVGYSGWGEGQLVDEVGYVSWMLGELDANYVFGKQKENLWRTVLEHEGDIKGVIGQMPLPHWN